MKLSSQQEEEGRHKNKEQVDMSIVVQPFNLVHKGVLALDHNHKSENHPEIRNNIGCEMVRVDWLEWMAVGWSWSWGFTQRLAKMFSAEQSSPPENIFNI